MHRGLIGFVHNGVLKSSYSHSDSHYECLGLRMLEHARSTKRGRIKIPAKILALRVVNPNLVPSAIDMGRLAAYTDTSFGDPNTWAGLLGKTAGNPQAILNCGYIEDCSELAYDSQLCEYAYIEDWDRRVLEVYEGNQREYHTDGRFVTYQARSGYYPVRLVGTFAFDNLPTPAEFLEILSPVEA